ncbi:MAG TPA: S-adenosylmethionine:tRNA ribosyltransferase-isomerase, partial [Flavisolibacter sp.]
LPAALIAELPLQRRSASSMLVYQNGAITDELFENLLGALTPDCFLVFNDSRVIEARLHFQKPSGAEIEIFCLQPYVPGEMTSSFSQTAEVQWACFVGGASKWKEGVPLEKKIQVRETEVTLAATRLRKEGDHYIIEFKWTGGCLFSEVLAAAGEIPLPPYIKRKREAWDAERYQTVFADRKGSVAAPTAALHFTPEIIDELSQRGVDHGRLSLHVGAGTFKPVKAETIDLHEMHSETFTVSAELVQALLNVKTIVAVGTTSLRSLESLFWIGIKLMNKAEDLCLGQWEAYELEAGNITYKDCLRFILGYMAQKRLKVLECRTSLLILPGYQFRSATALLTNFHQPRSTLLLLVAAFIGEDWKKVYDHAIKQQYRFLSYGDSSLLWRNP